jgi:tetratricopeptide (TPR) repeat protein
MLTAEQLQEIQERIDQGDTFLNSGNFARALELYQQAASLIPEPKGDYEISLPVLTAIGEALFYSGRYSDALSVFRRAAKSPGGIENPLVHLRLGQAYYELGDFDSAGDELTRAYMLTGEDIFQGEDEKKYFDYLKTRIEI